MSVSSVWHTSCWDWAVQCTLTSFRAALEQPARNTGDIRRGRHVAPRIAVFLDRQPKAHKPNTPCMHLITRCTHMPQTSAVTCSLRL